MEGLNRELHFGRRGMGEQSGNAVGDLFARFWQRLTGRGTADEDNHRRAKRRRFIDATTILVYGQSAASGGIGREKSATAKRHNRESLGADQIAERSGIAPLDRLTPDAVS